MRSLFFAIACFLALVISAGRGAAHQARPLPAPSEEPETGNSLNVRAHGCGLLVNGDQTNPNATVQDATRAVADCMYLQGYVRGVIDSTKALTCIPAGATSHQLHAVFARFLQDHPELWDRPAHTIVIAAMKQAFPCHK